MDRRRLLEFVASASLADALGASQALAQTVGEPRRAMLPRAGVARVGVLFVNDAPTDTRPDLFIAAFRRGLSQLGYVEGQNIQLAVRYKFQLVVNLTAAKAIGVTIPQSLLLRADEVIQ